MSTKPSPETIVHAFEALRPEAGELEQEWDAARRDRVLDAVLERTMSRGESHRRQNPAARWVGVGIAAAAVLVVAAMLVVPVLLPSSTVVPAKPAPPTSTPSTEPLPAKTSAPQPTAAGTPEASNSVTSPIEMPFTPYVEIVRQAAQADIDAWFAATEQPFAEQQKQIALCMADSGFDYQARTLPRFPVEWTVLGSLPGTDLELPWLPATREQVAHHGYGRLAGQLGDPSYPTNPYADSLSWTGGGVPLDEWNSAERANNATFETLSEAEQRKFMTVLEICGGERELRADHPEVPTKHALASRADYIDDEYPGSDGALDWVYEYEPIFQSLFAVFYVNRDHDFDLESMKAAGSLYTDPDVVELNSAWAACMADAGVVPETKDLEVPSRLGPDLATRTSWPWDSVNGKIDAEKYTAVALADFDCRGRTDYVDTLARLQAEREAEVVAAHQADLDALVSTWDKLKNR